MIDRPTAGEMADYLAYWARLFVSDGGSASPRAILCTSAARMFLATVEASLPEAPPTQESTP